jgi:type VI secretion system secreted protein Hcp
MAFDAFLEIDGIDGESLDKNHTGWIDIDSFSWGVTNTGSGAIGGGGGTGKAVAQDFHFAAAVSKASPNLMLASATGRHLRSAMLTCRTAGQPIEFLKIRLLDCLVSSYQLGGSAGDGNPEDQFSLNFVKMDFLYTVARTGETVETSIDFVNLPGA